MKRNSWLLMAAAVLMLGAQGCKTVEYVPVVEKEIHTDSIYFTKVQRDSIWLHDSIRVESRNDTVRVDRWHTKYVERQVHDTIYQARTDSIPVPYEVTKYIEKKLGWWQKTLMWCGILSLMALTLLAAWWVSKHKPFR